MTFHDSPGVCVVSVQAAKTTGCFSGLFKHQDPAAKLHQNRPLKPPVFTNKIVVPGGWQSQQIMRKCCRKPTHLFLPKSNLCSRSTAARSGEQVMVKVGVFHPSTLSKKILKSESPLFLMLIWSWCNIYMAWICPYHSLSPYLTG